MAEFTQRLSMKTVTMTVRLPRVLPLRIWVGSQLIKLAATIIGCGVKIDCDPAE